MTAKFNASKQAIISMIDRSERPGNFVVLTWESDNPSELWLSFHYGDLTKEPTNTGAITLEDLRTLLEFAEKNMP